jgi:agmatinase
VSPEPSDRIPGTGNYFEFVYADHATFGKAPVATPALLETADVGVFGIPWDNTSTLRPGARLGPRGIRQQSMWFHEVWNPGSTPMAGFEPSGERIRDRISIVDCGDVTVVPTDTAGTASTIRGVSATVAEHAFPLMLGGDHYVMYPTYQGVCDAHPDSVIGIIQLDAHNDLIDDDAVLGRHWSGTPIRRSMDHGALRPGAVAQIGLRGFVGETERAEQRAQGFTVISADETREMGARETIDRAVDAVLAHADAIYLTIDIDGVDPSCAPGTCTPVPGGFLSAEFLALTRELGRHHEIVAADIVEVAPPLDASDQTSILAAHALFSFIEQRFLRSPAGRDTTTFAGAARPAGDPEEGS